MKKRAEHQIKRDEQVKAGAYDGRYKVKVVPNKKKKLSREEARGPFSKKLNHPDTRGGFLNI